MLDSKADVEVESLLKVVLVLVAVLLVLEVVEFFVDSLAFVLGPLRPLLSLIVLALIVLWLLDRL